MDENHDDLNKPLPATPAQSAEPPTQPDRAPLPGGSVGRRKKQLLIAAVALLVLVIVAFAAYAIKYGSGTKQTSQTPTGQAQAQTQPTPPTKTDNASLQQDLNDATASMDRASQNQATADDALSDQQNQITVPTE